MHGSGAFPSGQLNTSRCMWSSAHFRRSAERVAMKSTFHVSKWSDVGADADCPFPEVKGARVHLFLSGLNVYTDSRTRELGSSCTERREDIALETRENRFFRIDDIQKGTWDGHGVT